jgi:hypothetical protein
VRSGHGLVTISYTNDGPIANAGNDVTVNKTQSFTLNANGSSDPNGDPLTYHWEIISGGPVVLNDPDENTPQATVNAVGDARTMTFKVTVTDSHGDSSTDTVVIRSK